MSKCSVTRFGPCVTLVMTSFLTLYRQVQVAAMPCEATPCFENIILLLREHFISIFQSIHVVTSAGSIFG